MAYPDALARMSSRSLAYSCEALLDLLADHFRHQPKLRWQRAKWQVNHQSDVLVVEKLR